MDFRSGCFGVREPRGGRQRGAVAWRRHSRRSFGLGERPFWRATGEVEEVATHLGSVRTGCGEPSRRLLFTGCLTGLSARARRVARSDARGPLIARLHASLATGRAASGVFSEQAQTGGGAVL